MTKLNESYKKCQYNSILSVMENNVGRARCFPGSRVPRGEIVFLYQVSLILSIASPGINWDQRIDQQTDQQLWVVLLSSCMGYLLPKPSNKSWVILPDLTLQQLHELLSRQLTDKFSDSDWWRFNVLKTDSAKLSVIFLFFRRRDNDLATCVFCLKCVDVYG